MSQYWLITLDFIRRYGPQITPELFNVYKLELSCEQGVQSSYCLLNEPGEQVAFLFVFDFKNILFLKK